MKQADLKICTGPYTLRNDAKLTHLRWSDPSAGTEIQLYLTRDGGHSWPGGHRTPVGDPPAQTILANDLMWRFFMDHPLR